MTASRSVTAPSPARPADSSMPGAVRGRGPFLAWPVTRQAFYHCIAIALIPALAWGVILFGSRPLAMVLLAVAASSLTYGLIKQGFKWQRAQSLLYVHCLVSSLALVALAHPTWPVWVSTALALLMPVLLALLGGPGRERVHVAVVAALAAQYALLAIPGHSSTGTLDAILARDRLLMGDISNQNPSARIAHHWPGSWELNGDDAVAYPLPAQVAARALDTVSSELPAAEHAGGLSAGQVKRIRTALDHAFTTDLPEMDLFMLGVAPNRVGAASLIAITLAGLYLSYRYILRPRSVLFFLIAFIVGTAVFTFTPATVHRVGLPMLWQLCSQFPGEILALFYYLLLNSDAGFAAVFILALPGTEPLTNRGRRIFLACAAIGAAALHRLEPGAPAATLALCLLMPLAPVFDRIFIQRSWLGAGRTTE
jgi:Na+-translocating ferredoxin:NAD+ oxidoreductase RnfD subunit